MDQMATIGKVINTHGIRGGLKVLPFSDFPDRVKDLRRLFVQIKGQRTPYPVVDAFVNGRYWVVFLNGVSTVEAAEELIGSLLEIPLSERVTLPENAFYLDEIIGLKVFTVDGDYLGPIKDVLQTGANDVYVIEREGNESQNTDILIPALKSVVLNIDIKNERMDVQLPDGLL
ncbi:MAG: 16S rRNA processing protein RimM [Clostridiales bacterium]|nr:16S rRNA processing protein RimM [Clostridiales bacterium]